MLESLRSDQSQLGSELCIFKRQFGDSLLLHIPSMDSPLANRIFRRLFAHDTCSRLRTVTRLSPHARLPPQCQQSRSFASTRTNEERKYGVSPGEQKAWQQRTDLMVEDKMEEFKKYPVITADELRSRKQRPRRVKMLMRDFIEGSITQYNVTQLLVLISSRLSVQPQLRLLLKASRHLLPGRPFQFQRPP
jgi:hypothetical protein